MTTKPRSPAFVAMRQAQDAWLAACAANADPALRAKLAMVSGRLEAEYRLEKLGRTRRPLPAGVEYCQRCGGFGGADQWPGFVCFACDGTGTQATVTA